MFDRTFQDVEHESWSQNATIYDRLFGDVSMQGIIPILNSLGDLTGKCHLDIACGTGHLVAAASKHGAISEGSDFAQPMIDVARKNYPDECFKVADATQLPYEDASFDAVTCSFGLSHIENPQAAVKQAFRVLRVGGRFAFTLWYGPDDGGDLQAIVRNAISSYATVPPLLPDSWTQLRFADQGACENLVKQAGFNEPQFKRLPIVLQATHAHTVFDILDKLSFRTNLILDSQTLTIKQRIIEHILSEIEARRVDGLITIGWPALLTIVEKPLRGEVSSC